MERLSSQCNTEYGLHFFKLASVKPSDTRKAQVNFGDKQSIQFDAPASHCFSGWDGYWSNFRLADYAAAVFPGAISAGYID